MIEISRSDIVSDYLMNYETEDRFIKLPIEGYLDLLGIAPNSSQSALFSPKSSIIKNPNLESSM